jgi:cytochrome c-type biogenesis protein CcmF
MIDYIGEHPYPGIFGQLGLVLGFVAAIFSSFSYFKAVNNPNEAEQNNWKILGRFGFLFHTIGILTVIGMMFLIMTKKYYEYQYGWQHVSDDLPFKYIFAAFWEGQEGSFLLWMFWHIVLGGVLIFKSGKWESPVLSILALVQVFIASMILGIHIGWGEHFFKLGSNPFLLLRDIQDIPLFKNPNYVSMIKGNGLNPLLQNYWMTIHPPTLFLGFASVTIPFCFAFAGAWTRQYTEWLKPALPWALFSTFILGLGILMGGAWAYEALSFGGYWAWDPVENMSLVPWLVMVAGLHANLVARSTGYSVKSTYIMYFISFVLILYSTFLTRSGVLGKTSVHAFTEMGLEWHLVIFVVSFLLLGLWMYFRNSGKMPVPEKEESLASKEFWMFIGALVLLFSAVLITFSTSIPVYNSVMEGIGHMLDKDFSAYAQNTIAEPIPHYNKTQIWIAFFIGLLSGFAQYLRYKEFNWASQARKFGIQLLISLALAGVLTFLTNLFLHLFAWQYFALLFAVCFTIVCNLSYLITYIKGNMKLAGSVLSHTGFGIMVIGILSSGLNQQHISSNAFAMDGLIEGFDTEALNENIMLIKGAPMYMNGYEVTYVKDTIDGLNRAFEIMYRKKDAQGKVIESFVLKPNVLYEKNSAKIAASNPATKRYLDKDIFTHIAALPRTEDPEFARQVEDTLKYKELNLVTGQTSTAGNYEIRLKGITQNPVNPDYIPEANDLAAGILLDVTDLQLDTTYTIQPMMLLRDSMVFNMSQTVGANGLKFKLGDAAFEALFGPENPALYTKFKLLEGQSFQYKGYNIQFTGFNKSVNKPTYKPENGDIAVGAKLSVQAPDGKKYQAEPVYFLRDSRPMNIRDQVKEAGLYFRFPQIDPETKTIDIYVAHYPLATVQVPVKFAEHAPLSNYVVLEAILFPGINLFWLGSLLMLFGTLFSLFWRRHMAMK